MRSSLFWFRLGGWLTLLNGPPHLIGFLTERNPAPANATEAELYRLVREYKFHLMGVERSFEDINSGFSLCFAIFAILVGVFVLAAARHGHESKHLVRDLAYVAAIGNAILCVVNLIYTVPPPAILLGLAALSFTAAILTSHGRLRVVAARAQP